MMDMDRIRENSFKDFHAKGVDYICLHRSPTLTTKLYFFDGDVAKLPEVVHPHDHRYAFGTQVLCGASQNVWFREDPAGKLFNRFRYMTPLNGGNGFTEAGEARLLEEARLTYLAGDRYTMEADELHTIRIIENETVLLTHQFEDVVGLGHPTQTFTLGAAPSLAGLYSRFTADEITARLSKLRDRLGVDLGDIL